MRSESFKTSCTFSQLERTFSSTICQIYVRYFAYALAHAVGNTSELNWKSALGVLSSDNRDAVRPKKDFTAPLQTGAWRGPVDERRLDAGDDSESEGQRQRQTV